MKKARIALTAIALFAVIGGALAIKASRSGLTYYTTLIEGAVPGAANSLTNATTTSTGTTIKYYTLISTAQAFNSSYVTSTAE
jgi:hypothetical protein